VSLPGSLRSFLLTSRSEAQSDGEQEEESFHNPDPQLKYHSKDGSLIILANIPAFPGFAKKKHSPLRTMPHTNQPHVGFV
jgi:hypothetical protein